MVRHGVPTVTFGAGQNEVHTIDEWINLDEYDRACACGPARDDAVSLAGFSSRPSRAPQQAVWFGL